MKKTLFIIFTFFIFQIPTFSAHTHLEKEYQTKWCNLNNGILEHKLPDSTRIDCLTPNYAIEFDFAPKWAESVGQSLFYAHSTAKKPGIVLILENPDKDVKYLNRLKSIAQVYNIKIWTMTAEDI